MYFPVRISSISAAKNEGIDELVQHALHVAKYQEKPQIIDFCDANEDGGAVHRCLHAIMHLIEDHAKAARIPVRFAAAKLAEGDQLIMDSLNLDQNEKEMLEHIVKQMETERGLDRAAAIAHMRFDFIEKVCDETVVKPKESKEHLRSMKIDDLWFFLIFCHMNGMCNQFINTFIFCCRNRYNRNPQGLLHLVHTHRTTILPYFIHVSLYKRGNRNQKLYSGAAS